MTETKPNLRQKKEAKIFDNRSGLWHFFLNLTEFCGNSYWLSDVLAHNSVKWPF